MRIRTLALERYGPFTGQSLSFRPDAKLHIVYGPNEAGKSSALAAIADLFFKIEPRTQYDFVHKAKDMRIGAVIEARNGSRLSFQRRKGNKDTLLDAADIPLSDDFLLPFLGHLTRDVFTHAFGLNTAMLRQGAEEMMKSGGEIGASLFAAASGMKGMTDLRLELEKEADSIFGQRAAKDRKFYQILDRNEIARRAIRDLELKAGDWKKLNEEIEAYAGNLLKGTERRAENLTESAQLSRLKRVAPLMRLIDADIEKLKSVGDLPEVAPGFTERLRVEIDDNRKVADDRKRASEDQEEARRELSTIAVNETLLAHADEIQVLFGRTGAYEKDQRDIPRIQAEADEFSACLNQLAVRLGLADASEVKEKQPADIVYAAIRGLISEGKRLSTSLDGFRYNISSDTETLTNLEEQRTTREVVPNPRHLRIKLVAVGPVLKQLDRCSERERAIGTEAKIIKLAAARLNPPVVDLNVTARAPMPSAETIARFRLEFDNIDADLQRENQRILETVVAIAEIERRLQTYAAHGVVPSDAAIAAERQERDKTWSDLRNSLMGTAPTLVGLALTGTILAFEKHSSESDRLADAAVTNADGVANYTADLRRLSEERTKQSSTKGRQEKLQVARHTTQEAWTTLWQPARLTPLPPIEMTGWLSKVEALFARLEKNDVLRDDAKRIEIDVLAIVPALEKLAGEAGISLVEGLDPTQLLQQIQDRLNTIESIWDESSKVETSIKDTQTRVDRLRKKESEATLQMDTWKGRWGAVLPGLGLSATATVDEAEVALSAWQKVPDTLREHANRLRRVGGMQRDSDEFKARAESVVEATAQDLLSFPFETAVKKLSERLTEATNTKARRDQVASSLEKASRSLKITDNKMKASKSALDLLTACVPPDTDLLELLVRFSVQKDVTDSLTDHRNQLISQGDGFTEVQIRTELKDFHVDETAARLQELSGEDKYLESDARDNFANQKVATNRRAELQQGMGAEVANQQKKNAEAELLAATREWLVLRFSWLLIGHAVERSRASQHNPLIKRAGELFSTITGGAFVGIGQDFGEDDIPYLVGQRSSKENVTVPGLSEGARDQLFLALRLAYLESFAESAEPIPFIGDDLFTSFDEDRTANGLSALAAIGDKIQPILFTHHRHVVEIARARIGAAADVIEMKQ